MSSWRGVLGLRFLQQSSSDWHWEWIHFAHCNAFPGTHSAPPLLIINMYLMSLFSELQWLFYHHHHRYFCHKNISNSISSYHGNFPLNHPIWIKAWRGCAQSIFSPSGAFYWKLLGGKKKAQDKYKQVWVLKLLCHGEHTKYSYLHSTNIYWIFMVGQAPF